MGTDETLRFHFVVCLCRHLFKYQKKTFTIDFYHFIFIIFEKNICAPGKKVCFLVSEVNFELCVLFVILSRRPGILWCTGFCSFSQFHSDEFEVQWGPMSHLVRGPTSHLVWPNG